MGMGLMGAWVAQLCDQAFRAVFIYSRYKSGAWKHTRVWATKAAKNTSAGDHIN